MSETGAKGKNGINVYIDGVDGESPCDRARKLLAGIPDGAKKAIGSALKRAIKSGETLAAKEVSKEYLISAGDFKKYTQHKNVYETAGGVTSVNILFRGKHIPIVKFDSSVGKDGRVAVRVKRGSTKKTLDRAFSTSNIGDHQGVYERVGKSRVPTEEIYGPATPQMLSYNEELSRRVGDKIRETFESRLEHEILAVMNGWRK